MDTPTKRSKVFEVLADPCAYFPGARRFVPLRKLRRLAEQEQAVRAREARRTAPSRR